MYKAIKQNQIVQAAPQMPYIVENVGYSNVTTTNYRQPATYTVASTISSSNSEG